MSAKKQLAIISSRFPYPLNKGDKLRLFHQIKHLAQHFEIHLHAINEENISLEEQASVRALCAEVHLYKLNPIEQAWGIIRSIIKSEPIQVGYFYSSSIRKKIAAQLKNSQIEAVYCQLSRTAYYALDFKGASIIDYQDCFSKNYERAAAQHTGLKKIFYKREHNKMQSFEQLINRSFDAKTIISAFDREQLPFTSDSVHIIPNGVDKDFYKEQAVTKEYDILFSGNLNYQPNEQAALYIINELAPALINEQADIKICIAGNTSNNSILQAASKNIIIENKVADMRDMYARTKLFIAPLFSGAGLQNKLLEAMSMCIPCISTSVTNHSLKAQVNEEIIIADNTESFKQSIFHLLKNETERYTLASKGQTFVHEKYNWEQPNEQLVQIIKDLLG